MRITAAATASGRRTDAGVISGGVFEVRQHRRKQPVTTLLLCAAATSRCPSTSARRAGKRSRRVIRRLSGTTTGRFRIRGRYAQLLPRQGTWTVQDRCDGTLSRVARKPAGGLADVHDSVKKRLVRLRTAKRYLAERRR